MTLTNIEAMERVALHQRAMVPLALSSTGYLLAYVLSLFCVETVMATGPVLSGLGLWLTVLGVRASNPAASILGLGHAMLALTLFFTVHALDWSPDEARHPFAVIGAIGASVTVILALLALPAPSRPRPVQALAVLRHTIGAEVRGHGQLL